jgi:hypothetical protein
MNSQNYKMKKTLIIFWNLVSLAIFSVITFYAFMVGNFIIEPVISGSWQGDPITRWRFTIWWMVYATVLAVSIKYSFKRVIALLAPLLFLVLTALASGASTISLVGNIWLGIFIISVVVSIVAVQYSSQRLLWLIPFIVLIIWGSLTVYENYRTTADYNNTIVSRYNTAHRISSGQAK